MNIIEKEIQRLQKEVKKSDEELEWMPDCPEKTREFYHNGNMHIELRKLTVIANQYPHSFYCSRCGERFKSAQLRTDHTLNQHGR